MKTVQFFWIPAKSVEVGPVMDNHESFAKHYYQYHRGSGKPHIRIGHSNLHFRRYWNAAFLERLYGGKV